MQPILILHLTYTPPIPICKLYLYSTYTYTPPIFILHLYLCSTYTYSQPILMLQLNLCSNLFMGCGVVERHLEMAKPIKKLMLQLIFQNNLSFGRKHFRRKFYSPSRSRPPLITSFSLNRLIENFLTH